MDEELDDLDILWEHYRAMDNDPEGAEYDAFVHECKFIGPDDILALMDEITRLKKAEVFSDVQYHRMLDKYERAEAEINKPKHMSCDCIKAHELHDHINMLLSHLHASNVVGMVQAFYSRFGNTAPPELLKAEIDYLENYLKELR